MKLPRLNNWAYLGVLLMFGMTIAEAFESETAAIAALFCAIGAFGMWIYTERQVG